jgi:hypothetical protein
MRIPNSLRLSLRELFLLVALVAGALGWYIDHRRMKWYADDVQSLLDTIETFAELDPPGGFRTNILINGRDQCIDVQTLGPINLIR